MTNTVQIETLRILKPRVRLQFFIIKTQAHKELPFPFFAQTDYDALNLIKEASQEVKGSY